MRIARLITTIDSHMAGENVRVITSGIPYVRGKTMIEKMRYYKRELESIRTTLMYEPRGYSAMFGCVLVPPTVKDADLGILFMGSPGYIEMCGHALIGATTVVLESGMIKSTEPTTIIKWDTCAGVVVTKANIKKGRVKSVTFENVPSFLYRSDVVKVDGLGEFPVDICFGGVFTAILSAENLNIEVKPEYSTQILDLGEKILKVVNEQAEIKHPDKPSLNRVSQVMITDTPLNPLADYRNVVVCCYGIPRVKKAIDRSPCGTGTCARMAQLYSKGELRLNQEFVHESIIGTLFKGRLVSEVLVGDYYAVIPEITGSAYITGIHQFIVDPEDPLKNGFLL